MMSEGQKCRYQLLENGIHDIQYADSSSEAVFEMLEIVERILASSQPDRQVRFLVEGNPSEGTGFVPMKAIIKMQELGKLYKDTRHIRAASIARRPDVLLPDKQVGRFISPGDTLFNLLTRQGQYHQFTPQQPDESIQWLLKDSE